MPWYAIAQAHRPDTPVPGTNRANAHESTGPGTPGGKDRVELNALAHGVGKSLARFFRHSPGALAPWGKQRLAEVSRLCRRQDGRAAESKKWRNKAVSLLKTRDSQVAGASHACLAVASVARHPACETRQDLGARLDQKCGSKAVNLLKTKGSELAGSASPVLPSGQGGSPQKVKTWEQSRQRTESKLQASRGGASHETK